MRKVNLNRLNMYFAVRSTCKQHEDVWKNVNGFVKVYDKFETMLKKISAEMDVQHNVTTGVSDSKTSLKSALSNLALKISGAIVSIATDKDDSKTVGISNRSESFMMRGRQAEVLQYFETLSNIATEMAEELIEYGIDQSILDDYQNKVSEYNDLIASPRIAIARRSVATARLNRLFSKASKVLSMQLDGLVENFKESAPDFYENYIAARTIVNLKNASPEDNEETSDGAASESPGGSDGAADSPDINTDEAAGGASGIDDTA